MGMQYDEVRVAARTRHPTPPIKVFSVAEDGVCNYACANQTWIKGFDCSVSSLQLGADVNRSTIQNNKHNRLSQCQDALCKIALDWWKIDKNLVVCLGPDVLAIVKRCAILCARRGFQMIPAVAPRLVAARTALTC